MPEEYYYLQALPGVLTPGSFLLSPIKPTIAVTTAVEKSWSDLRAEITTRIDLALSRQLRASVEPIGPAPRSLKFESRSVHVCGSPASTVIWNPNDYPNRTSPTASSIGSNAAAKEYGGGYHAFLRTLA